MHGRGGRRDSGGAGAREHGRRSGGDPAICGSSARCARCDKTWVPQTNTRKYPHCYSFNQLTQYRSPNLSPPHPPQCPLCPPCRPPRTPTTPSSLLPTSLSPRAKKSRPSVCPPASPISVWGSVLICLIFPDVWIDGDGGLRSKTTVSTVLRSVRTNRLMHSTRPSPRR